MEEDAVAIVFSMWGITPETIAQLLTNKQATVRGVQEGMVAGLEAIMPQYERTTNAVQSRLARIHKVHPELWSNRESWNRGAVHAFLKSSLLDHDLLRSLLTLTPSDIEMIIQVCFYVIFRRLVTDIKKYQRVDHLLDHLPENNKASNSHGARV